MMMIMMTAIASITNTAAAATNSNNNDIIKTIYYYMKFPSGNPLVCILITRNAHARQKRYAAHTSFALYIGL